MAGDWIKWTKGLAYKREVVLIASRLQMSQYEIAGRLMLLWEWCDDNVNDEDVDPVSLDVSLILGDKAAAFVDALCGLPGLADTLASPEIRWIEFRSGGRVVFPNLARHNGTSAKTRAYGAEKKRRQRAKACNASELSPEMSPKIGDKCPQKLGTREEKRRDKEECSARARDPTTPPPALPPPEKPSLFPDPKILSHFEANEVASELCALWAEKVGRHHALSPGAVTNFLTTEAFDIPGLKAAISNYGRDRDARKVESSKRLGIVNWLVSGEFRRFLPENFVPPSAEEIAKGRSDGNGKPVPRSRVPIDFDAPTRGTTLTVPPDWRPGS